MFYASLRPHPAYPRLLLFHCIPGTEAEVPGYTVFAHRLFISDYSGVDYIKVKLGWIRAEWDRTKAARSSCRIKGNISWDGLRSECVSLMESHVCLVALRDVCPEKHLI